MRLVTVRKGKTLLVLVSALTLATTQLAWARDDRDRRDDRGERSEGNREKPDFAIQPTFNDVFLFTVGYNLTTTIATLLDQLSNAPTDLNGSPFPPWLPEETVLLNKVGDLLTEDIVVNTNGLVFATKPIVLAGQRLIHSIREDKSTRYESTPALKEVHLDANPPTFTMTTRQQQFWIDPPSKKEILINRETEFSVVFTESKWRINNIKLQTISGPYEVNLPVGPSSYGPNN